MVEDLVYDIGMHDGSDTAYYLFKGYRVIAVEANPLLAEAGRERFKDEIAKGQLTILPVGISDAKGEATFYVNDEKTDWSSFIPDVAGRDGMACRPVKVPITRFKDIFKEFGVPYYLKIDIEKNDVYCLEDLDPTDLPRYTSVEAHTLCYLCTLSEKGYNQFKCVSQVAHNYGGIHSQEQMGWSPKPPEARGLSKLFGTPQPENPNPVQPKVTATDWVFPEGASGPIGEDTPGPWETMEEVILRWLPAHIRKVELLQPNMALNSWYDFHAKVG